LNPDIPPSSILEQELLKRNQQLKEPDLAGPSPVGSDQEIWARQRKFESRTARR